MYEEFFRFKRKPFSIAPDPAFLFLSERHREALAHLMYGLESDGGFVLVTGEVGTGKTTLIRSLVERIPEGVDVAFMLNPRVTARELLESLCEELGIPEAHDEAHSVKHYVDRLTKHLLRTHQLGRSTVMIIDEAQNLSPSVLEQIRLLTNLETNQRKLLRIILLGQPELAELLDRREMRQLAQRVTARYHLSALDADETRAYIAHRLTLAGGSANIFTAAACRRAHQLSGGIPRVINVLADRALLGAYVEGKPRVRASVVARAGQEILGRRVGTRHWIFAGLGVAALVGVAWGYLRLPDETTAPRSAAAQVSITQPQNPQVATPAAPALAPRADAAESPAAPPAAATEAPAARPGLSASSTSTTPEPRPAVTQSPSSDLQRPQGRSGADTQRDAYRRLFELWHQPMDDSDIPCNVATHVGLQCLRDTGGWSALVHIDRPAVLELWGSDAQPFYGAAVAIDGDRIDVEIDGATTRVTRDVLEQHWYGAFVVLWRMPPDYRGRLQVGDAGPTTAWLRQQLATVQPDKLDSEHPDVFDQGLRDALVRFQRSAGVVPDGVVGPATWIALDSARGGDDPRIVGAR